MKLIDPTAYRYGLLRAEDAPKLLDYATSPSSLPWFSRWRGRLGLSSDQVRAAYASRPAAEAENKLDEPRHELGDSVELVFKTFEGEERRVSGYEGESVMVRFSSPRNRHVWDDILKPDCTFSQETARRHELPSILATCGGHCECATCHVLIPPAASPAPARNDGRRGRAARVCDRRDGRLAPGLSVARHKRARQMDREGRTDTASSILNRSGRRVQLWRTYMKLES